jgi:hypothetical protein
MRPILYSSILVFLTFGAFSQVGIGTNSPDPSSIFEVKSTSKGLLAPRMSAAQMLAISAPADGLLVYCNAIGSTVTATGFYYYDAPTSTWTPLKSSSSSSQSLSGDLNMNGANILNASSVQSGKFQILDNNQHTFFGGSDALALTTISRSGNKTMFLDGRTANSLLTIQNSTSSTNADRKEGVIGIGTDVPDYSAKLDVSSTEKGMLVPRMTGNQVLAITSPANGLLAYATSVSTTTQANGSKIDAVGFWYYDVNIWRPINYKSSTGAMYGKPVRITNAYPIDWQPDDVVIQLPTTYTTASNVQLTFPNATSPENLYRVVGISNRSTASKFFGVSSAGSPEGTKLYSDQLSQIANATCVWFISDGIAWRVYVGR